MSKILLERSEWTRINEVLEKYKGINYCEIEVESISGIGKVTQLTIPYIDFGVTDPVSGKLVITITDENDW